MAQTPPQTLDQIARNRIKAWIAGTGITQTELGLRIGKNQAWMSRYLSGEFDADLETLQKMALVFEHQLASLLDTPKDPDEAQLIEGFRALRKKGREVILRAILEMNRGPRTDPPSRS